MARTSSINFLTFADWRSASPTGGARGGLYLRSCPALCLFGWFNPALYQLPKLKCVEMGRGEGGIVREVCSFCVCLQGAGSILKIVSLVCNKFQWLSETVDCYTWTFVKQKMKKKLSCPWKVSTASNHLCLDRCDTEGMLYPKKQIFSLIFPHGLQHCIYRWHCINKTKDSETVKWTQ